MQNTIIDKNWKSLIKPSKLSIKSSEDKSVFTLIAAPCSDESKILLRAFPIVSAYPFSKGSAVSVKTDLSSLLLIFNLLGLIKDFQFCPMIVFCI